MQHVEGDEAKRGEFLILWFFSKQQHTTPGQIEEIWEKRERFGSLMKKFTDGPS